MEEKRRKWINEERNGEQGRRTGKERRGGREEWRGGS